MSLIAMAIRIAATRAIMGAGTLAEDRVYDSSITPIDVALEEERRPFVIVVTEDETGQVTGKDLLMPDRRMELTIEVAMASREAQEIDGEEVISVLIPHTDAKLEMAINLLGRQVLRALVSGESPWSQVFLRLVTSINEYSSRRGAGSEKGVRFAARQIVLNMDTVGEPMFGEDPHAGGAWALFLETLADDEELSHLHDELVAITKGEPLTWERARIALGLADDEISGIGIQAAAGPEAAPLVGRVDYTGAPGPITEAAADEQFPEAPE